MADNGVTTEELSTKQGRYHVKVSILGRGKQMHACVMCVRDEDKHYEDSGEGRDKGIILKL